MIKVLFICHGNICRSPMAEMILKYKINNLNKENEFLIDSMAVSSKEIGNSIYPQALKVLKNHNIPVSRHQAKKFEAYYYDDYDYIICMDNSNLLRLNQIYNDSKGKYRLLSSFLRQSKDVDDPWYTRDFEACYNEIDKYLDGFIKYLIRYKKL